MARRAILVVVAGGVPFWHDGDSSTSYGHIDVVIVALDVGISP